MGRFLRALLKALKSIGQAPPEETPPRRKGYEWRPGDLSGNRFDNDEGKDD